MGDDMWDTVPTSVQSNVTDYFPDEKSLRPPAPPPPPAVYVSPEDVDLPAGVSPCGGCGGSGKDARKPKKNCRKCKGSGFLDQQGKPTGGSMKRKKQDKKQKKEKKEKDKKEKKERKAPKQDKKSAKTKVKKK